MHTVEIITTGGTIDGFDSNKGTKRDHSDAALWLQKQPELKVIHTAVLSKDSREITDDDRGLIVKAIQNSNSELLLITHGTYTMCKTGRFLKAALKNLNLKKSIVIVGAWIPFSEKNSDALKQIEFALQTLKEKPKDIVIAMDDITWNPDTTEKIKTESGSYKLSRI